jgi:hypothetical protein
MIESCLFHICLFDKILNRSIKIGRNMTCHNDFNCTLYNNSFLDRTVYGHDYKQRSKYGEHRGYV